MVTPSHVGRAGDPDEPGLEHYRLLGVDFTSAPSRRKPIVVADLRFAGASLELHSIEAMADFASFERMLAAPGPWVAGFDLPFGLPREFVIAQGWPLDWAACMDRYAALDRARLRDAFRAFCDARPAGRKFAHRRTDGPAGSSPSMKWVNPPVAWMMHAGVPRLRAAGLHLPGLVDGDRSRVGVEAYPGMLARAITRQSYKSDAPRGDTSARRAARECILAAIEQGRHPEGGPVSIAADRRERLLADARGDALDALLCALLAAWSARRRHREFGCPADHDLLEGWIAAAG
ncbi:MAG: DUF429 domain-containing protein [Burkholderiaceae bacterium]